MSQLVAMKMFHVLHVLKFSQNVGKEAEALSIMAVSHFYVLRIDLFNLKVDSSH